ncbi:hypothetical protein [Aidingimonas halophila]|uniref:Uncharacterized protein n=1 Tax=Aidingimonas halophila TaxID=574349 RepID=A0A1H3A2L9_9GAMM|nr:hypothetical protein [Aidingimonas halophila]GHC21458.1 hypothetical protein GCM10008094_10180 [Aidingimonas halophila]SDX23907.1 hypothetical protein SAMN05443545_104339 [Aidingimonas halophila]
MDIVISAIKIVGLVGLLLWYLLFAPSGVREWLEYALLSIQAAVFWCIDVASKSIDIAVHLFHWLGRFFVVVIFVGAAITLSDNMAAIFGLRFLEKSGAVFEMTRLFADRVTWVASTAIVATTVALGHFKTLDLNYKKHREEVREKLRENRDRKQNT